MRRQRPREQKSAVYKVLLHERRATENLSARRAQWQRQRGRNLPVFLNCSCSLDHSPATAVRQAIVNCGADYALPRRPFLLFYLNNGLTVPDKPAEVTIPVSPHRKGK